MKKTGDLSIGMKLTIAFASLILMFLTSSGVCFYSVQAIAEKEKQVALSEQALKLIKDGDTDYLNIIWAVLANNLNGQPGHKKWKTEHINDFRRRLLDIKALEGDGARDRLVDDSIANYNAWKRKVVDPLFAMRAKVDAYSSNISDLSELTESFGSYLGTDALVGSIARLEQYETAQVIKRQAELDAFGFTISISMLLASTGAVVAAVFAGRWLARNIRDPLAQAVQAAEMVANGHLDRAVRTYGMDETGRLLHAIQQMQLSLLSIIEKVRSGCQAVKDGTSQIAAGNIDLSSRTEEQAASLEETASSMTQLTETVKQNADNARQANALAMRATDVADMGNDAVQSMVQTIGEIRDSSTKISEITGTIESIAFQTNILALNAAVEAARAGEQGRGFAVVASEVRSLAQRSASAAKEIKELISTSVAMIQDGAKQATDVGGTMGQVKQAIKQVSEIVGEIAAASDEQSCGIEQVNQAVVQMDTVTQQNAALVEQAAAAAHSLEEQAMNLSDAVSVFKVSESESSA
ncbi:MULTISPECIES: methyl-accepting chemotaxis protein [unclassified Burkholderia]|uniref:methyl-accepting chemotaxis protein n=1 Tax=unclassified Burkholderia TaxID=2613784 RepID=UPI002AB16F98|nr:MULTISPECIES: methyl-accepting chemotaxis protein [unclassified Burkholderia]